MEKIQKALEKARQQRLGTLAAAGATDPEARSGSRSGFRSGQARSGHSQSGETGAEDGGRQIVYQQTRVVAPAEETLAEGRVVAGLPQHELADAFRMLRTQVLQRLTLGGYSTLAITSANRGDGKSLMAVNLALSLALHVDRTVLLVDLDLRRPRVHSYFGIEPEAGLTDYLLHDTPLSACLINPGIDRLVILPVRTALHASSELLSAPKMIRLAEELKARYPDRIVLYDLPPVLVSDDALAFLRHVDCCLFVVQDGQTPKGDIVRAVELLADCTVIGTVLNKASAAVKPYY
ncbi:MAG TPA: CpsD/CapB family tyrosine-protein kinase [Rhodospirillales bacterium]|nr:CpsD/CapB family tyrosine-protein kinase [Rhodospirillales bacterium]